MDQRIGIIDLGSNSCRLVIFAVEPQLSFKLIDQVSERVRIGEGGFADGYLQPEPMARAVQLLKMFRDLCDSGGIDRVIAVATSAVRDAANRDEFLDHVRREARLTLRVLSGDEEAYYAYLGAVNSLSLRDGFVADLGGGSLELTRVRGRIAVACRTLPLGAVRLAEQYLRSDPISSKDERALLAQIDEQLDSVRWLRGEPHDQLVVVGGTARALAKMDQERREHPLDRLHGYQIAGSAIQDYLKLLLKTNLAGRLELDGLNSERADIIPAGVAVVARLAKHLGADEVVISGQGLREGLFYDELLRNRFPSDLHWFAPRPAGLDLPPGFTSVPLVPDVRTLGVANIGCHYEIDWAHAAHVCRLSLALFDQLERLHDCGARERELLGAAAALHDVGVAVDYYRHHRHSAYLIENADLPGFSHREIALIALLVRWHRQGTPRAEEYARMLDGDDRERMRKLVAILRLAEDLERSRVQNVVGVRCTVGGSAVAIEALTRGSAEAELWAANRNDDMFRSVFGRKLNVRASAVSAAASHVGPPPAAGLLERARQLDELLHAPSHA